MTKKYASSFLIHLVVAFFIVFIFSKLGYFDDLNLESLIIFTFIISLFSYWFYNLNYQTRTSYQMNCRHYWVDVSDFEDLPPYVYCKRCKALPEEIDGRIKVHFSRALRNKKRQFKFRKKLKYGPSRKY